MLEGSDMIRVTDKENNFSSCIFYGLRRYNLVYLEGQGEGCCCCQMRI